MTDSPEYPVVVYPDHCTDGSFCYVATHPDLPGCAAHGDTIPEARALLGDARVAYLAAVAADGKDAPAPSETAPSEITWEVGPLTDGYMKFTPVSA